MPAPVRKSSRPAPGRPAGKMESVGCIDVPRGQKGPPPDQTIEDARRVDPPMEVGLDLDEAAAHRDGDRFGAVAGAELLQDVFHVDLDRLLRDEEMVRDLPIAASGGELLEHL